MSIITGIFDDIKKTLTFENYWKWKKIVEFMQILKDNNAARDDCSFKNLFTEWDSFIMAGSYGWLNIGDLNKPNYLMVPYKEIGDKIVVTLYFESCQEIEGIFGLGSISPMEWTYDNTLDRKMEVTEDQIYFGVFSPVNKLCNPITPVNIKTPPDDQRLIQGFQMNYISTALFTFLNAKLNYVELFFEKVMFYIKLNKMQTLKSIDNKPSLKF